MKPFVLAVCAVICAGSASASSAQDATLPNARYCGIGIQGEAATFKTNNPLLWSVFNSPKTRPTINAALLSKAKTSNWKINLYGKDDPAGNGASLAMSHVLTYERVEQQPFVDPRDGASKLNIAYSFGISTVVFDLNDRHIKSLIPAVITFSDVSLTPPTPAAQAAAFAAVFAAIDDPDSAIGRWLASINAMPMRVDERVYLRVAPVVLSEEAAQTLQSESATPRQTTGIFVQNLTSQFESLLAASFAKPIVPSQTNDQGGAGSGNQYVASLSDCADKQLSLILPPPSYELHLYVEKLASTTVKHDLESLPNLPSRGAQQTEQAYGGRYRAEITEYVDTPSGGNAKVLDSHTFRFARSIRFTGQRQISAFEQHFKLTSNFIRSLLDAYAVQNRKWIAENMSASVTDRSQRDDGKIAKGWKSLIAQTMSVSPPAKAADAASPRPATKEPS